MICAICESSAFLRCDAQPGYVAGTSYAVYECTGCDASFVSPRRTDGRIYDDIYTHAATISGYDRYIRYAALVQGAKKPRRRLAACEDVYAAIDAMVGHIEAARPRLLEIGSGLGYLTYALARSGCAIEGWDISAIAVAAANRRFGPYFHVRDIFALPGGDAERFDAILMTELIEHVEDPLAFFRAARRFLAPGGRFIVTTPNKSFFAPAPVWHTDPPPVHLWWLSERSIDVLGERLAMSVRLFDFTRYNDRHRPARPAGLPMQIPTRESKLKADGRPIVIAPPPEPWRLFPLSQSLVPAVAGPIRSLARAFGVPLDRGPAAGRRPTCAFELRAK